MNANKPTKAFFIASVIALLTGFAAYITGLLNADMPLNEKGYYFAVFLESKLLPNKAFGHFAPKIIYNLSLL